LRGKPSKAGGYFTFYTYDRRKILQNQEENPPKPGGKSSKTRRKILQNQEDMVENEFTYM
jgi:hypothetical protein